MNYLNSVNDKKDFSDLIVIQPFLQFLLGFNENYGNHFNESLSSNL